MSTSENRSDFSIQDIGSGQLAMPGAIRLPMLSFVLTGRSGADFGPAIEALRMQDYARFEVIVVDAAPTDSSRADVERQVAGDPRFRRIDAAPEADSFRQATLGLAAAEGEFVAFLDADERPSPGFASAHIQVHLASRHNIAFTASARHGDGPEQTAGRAPTEIRATAPWLQPAAAVLRLASLDDAGFAELESGTVLVEPTTQGWTASADAVRVYRRFVLAMLLPPDGRTVPHSSADAHFAPLSQWLGGSAAIRVPLSKTLHASPRAGAIGIARDRDKLGVWAANGAEFSRRIGTERYWNAFAALLDLKPGTTPAPAGIAELMDGPFALLAASFGEPQAIDHLAALLSRPAVLAILRKRHGGQLPLRTHWAVRSTGLRRMHESLRRYLRARRHRRR